MRGHRRFIVVFVLMFLTCSVMQVSLRAESSFPIRKSRILLPVITGHAQLEPFTGHEGWVDVYTSESSVAESARIGRDASFHIERPKSQSVLIASFDRLELLPIIIPGWDGHSDITIEADYVCIPPGYPDVWGREYPVKGRNFWQTFIPHSSNLYNCTAFDGPKIAWWGNKFNFSVHRDNAHGPRIAFPVPWGTTDRDDPSGHPTDFEFPRVGWRHGDVQVVPGKRCAIRIGGYRGHGGDQLEANTFVRPDNGDGYSSGQAWNGDAKLDGDLCLIVQGDGNGQIVENQIRNEEWNVIVAKRVPVEKRGQTFLNHGRCMAGLVFWGINEAGKPISCTVRIRESGPTGKQIGPAKIAVGHEVPQGPFIAYPDVPGPMPGYESWYRQVENTDRASYIISRVFQIGYAPGEVILQPGQTYYVDLNFSAPIILYVDGDYYASGFAYYDGAKVERESGLQHGDYRFTLAMTIVTYRNETGR